MRVMVSRPLFEEDVVHTSKHRVFRERFAHASHTPNCPGNVCWRLCKIKVSSRGLQVIFYLPLFFLGYLHSLGNLKSFNFFFVLFSLPFSLLVFLLFIILQLRVEVVNFVISFP